MPETNISEKTEFKQDTPELKTDKTKEEIKWPALHNGPALFYDDEKHQAWYGIPYDQVNNPVIVLAAMDSIKLKILEHLNSYTRKMIENAKAKEAIKLPPASGIKDLLGKGKELLGLARA